MQQNSSHNNLDCGWRQKKLPLVESDCRIRTTTMGQKGGRSLSVDCAGEKLAHKTHEVLKARLESEAEMSELAAWSGRVLLAISFVRPATTRVITSPRSVCGHFLHVKTYTDYTLCHNFHPFTTQQTAKGRRTYILCNICCCFCVKPEK